MKRKQIFPRSPIELEMLSTKQLLVRLKQLHQCEESLDLSDRDVADDSGCIEFKQSSEWIVAMRDLKQVLAHREHVPRKLHTRIVEQPQKYLPTIISQDENSIDPEQKDRNLY